MFAISYDGKRGNKTFGKELPEELGLEKIEIKVGRSSQATLLGRQEITVESLYLSSSLSCDRNLDLESYISKEHKQITIQKQHPDLPKEKNPKSLIRRSIATSLQYRT